VSNLNEFQDSLSQIDGLNYETKLSYLFCMTSVANH